MIVLWLTLGVLSGAPEPQQPVREVGYIDGIGRKKTKRDEDDDRLHELIEAAFERVLAPGETPTKTEKKQVIASVRQEIKLDGVTATLAEIRKAVDAYAAWLKKKADDEEEDMIAFMMLN